MNTSRVELGDVFCADITKVVKLTDPQIPSNLKGKIYKIVGVVHVSGRPLPYCFTCSYNEVKQGPPPSVGDIATVRVEENPRAIFERGSASGKLYRCIFRIKSHRKKGETMFNKRKPSGAPSRDRVRFHLGYQYLQNKAIEAVLLNAFGIGPCDLTSLKGQSNGCGFDIICRPSQFARFLIFRNAAGISNGFKDLQPALYVPEPPRDGFDMLASAAGIDKCEVINVADALGLTAKDVECRLRRQQETHCRHETTVIDVSKNPYCPDD